MVNAGNTLYCVPAILGSTIYVIWRKLHPLYADTYGIVWAFALAAGLRLSAMKWNLRMPAWAVSGHRPMFGAPGWWKPPPMFDYDPAAKPDPT